MVVLTYNFCHMTCLKEEINFWPDVVIEFIFPVCFLSYKGNLITALLVHLYS